MEGYDHEFVAYSQSFLYKHSKNICITGNVANWDLTKSHHCSGVLSSSSENVIKIIGLRTYMVTFSYGVLKKY